MDRAAESLTPRVLLVTGTFPPGRCGIGDYVAQLARALADTGQFHIGILAGSEGPPVAPPGVELAGVVPDWRLAHAGMVLRLLREWRPALLHVHYPSRDYAAWTLPTLLPLLARLCSIRVVQTWHEPWPTVDAPRAFLQRLFTHGLVFVRPNYRELTPALQQPIFWGCSTRVIASAAALPTSRLDLSGRERVRARYLRGRSKLVAFFGFLYPSKGVEQLFEIADPETDSVVLVGSAPEAGYLDAVRAAAAQRGWRDADFQHTGHLPPDEAADILYAADAVVLPFLEGGGDWNTSILAALAQGTLVITTSTAPRGDEPSRNLYTSPIRDVGAMRGALRALAGRRSAALPEPGWTRIAQEHARFYRQLLPATDS